VCSIWTIKCLTEEESLDTTKEVIQKSFLQISRL